MNHNKENEHQVDNGSEELSQSFQEWLQIETEPGVPEEYFNETIRLGKIKEEINTLKAMDLNTATITERSDYAKELKVLYEERDAIKAFLNGESENPSAWNDNLRDDLRCEFKRSHNKELKKENLVKTPDWFADELNKMAKGDRNLINKSAPNILIILEHHFYQGDRSFISEISPDVDNPQIKTFYFSYLEEKTSSKSEKSEKTVLNWIRAWKKSKLPK